MIFILVKIALAKSQITGYMLKVNSLSRILKTQSPSL